jgi:hypothetical protein
MATAVPSETLDRHPLGQRFRPPPHVIWVRQAGATVLLDAEKGVYYTLNEVASRTWELLIAGEPLLEIVRCLKDEYDAPSEMIEADTTALLEHLLQTGLIARLPS